MKKTLLSTAVRSALGLSAVVGLMPGVTVAQEAGERVVEEVVVTGSRIKRSNAVSTSPIELITSQDFIDAGRFSVADALRSSTANSFGSFVPASGSSSQSQATVNLLGVGSERTLVLLDGLRLPGSPSLGGTSVNINQIPMAMVESIEVLKGGASAVYGSDAIAGVVNIKLKENYEGLEISVNTQKPNDPGGEASDFSLVTGISSDKGNITFAYEHAEQKPIFDTDRPYTAPSVRDTDGDGIFDTNIGISNFGASILNPTTELWEASPLCDELTATVPGFVGEIEGFPNDANRYCGYAYSGVSANQASTNRDSIFVNASYEITEDMNFFGRALFTHNESFGRYAPAAAPWLGGVPVGSEHNPYDESVQGQFRWYQLGNRDGNVSDYSQDYIAGLEGTFLNDFEYEIYYHHNTTDNKQVGEFYLSFSGLFYNIYAGNDLGSESGLNNMKATTLTQDRNRFDQLYAGISFEALELAGGTATHYVGAEGFQVDYQSIVDAQSEAGLIGGSAGNSAGQGRDIWAVFYETLLPVVDQVEVELAIRHDKYSDFGSKTSPKVAVTYRPVDELMLRGSIGKGFRAPELEQLSQADSFAADFATDYVACAANGTSVSECPENQYNTTRQANPNLDAETSTFINAGVVYGRDNFNISFDIFDLEIEDAIRFVPIQDLVLIELTGASNPDASLLEVDRTTLGPNNPEFRTSTINGPGLDILGWTLSTDYLLETTTGMFSFDFETTYFVDWVEDNFAGGPTQNKAGWSLQPKFRSQFTTTWTSGDHSLAWNIDYIPATSGFETPLPNQPTSGILTENEKNDSFMTHNITYTYDAGDWGAYRFGIRNLTDEDPILNSQGQYADQYDTLYSAGHIGRLFSVGASWSF